MPAFPRAARLAILVGHPSEPGPYVIRVKVPGGTNLMPHKHPDDRIYTVMSGVSIGLGESFEGDKVKAYPPISIRRASTLHRGRKVRNSPAGPLPLRLEPATGRSGLPSCSSYIAR